MFDYNLRILTSFGLGLFVFSQIRPAIILNVIKSRYRGCPEQPHM